MEQYASQTSSRGENFMEINMKSMDQHPIEQNCEEEFAMNCFLCQQVFTDIDEMQDHLSIHYADNWHQDTTTHYSNCNVCGRSLRSEPELNEHYRRYHEATMMLRKKDEDKQIFECKICGNFYIDDHFLNKHIEQSHSPKKVKESKKMYVASQYTEPKKKYPPRSPHFNPNLWLDLNGYI